MCPISSNKRLIYQHTDSTGHHVAFTSIAAGNMSLTVLDQHESVEQTTNNRRNLEAALGIEVGSTQFVQQTHSATVFESGTHGWQQEPTLGEGDAIVSGDGNDPIAVLVADCLPVAFTTDYGPTAITHAGRVGLLDGILENTVERLQELDHEHTGQIFATIGPGICGKCYEVPEDLRDTAAQSHQALASETSWNTPALDLPAAAQAILEARGVDVHRVEQCTLENSQLYSHRRQPGQGRLAGLVWKAPHFG